VITEIVTVTAVDNTHVKPLSKIYMLHKTWFKKDETVSDTASVLTFVARLCQSFDVCSSASYLMQHLRLGQLSMHQTVYRFDCESSRVTADIALRITTVQMKRYWKHSLNSHEVCQCPGSNPKIYIYFLHQST
jgi:hypothetical protein